MVTPREAALAALGAGISTVPPRQDGSKRPIGSWGDHMERRADAAEVAGWYARGITGVGWV